MKLKTLKLKTTIKQYFTWQAVQEVIASKSINQSHVEVVLTNNFFTKSAKELALKNNLLLWDRNKLIELLLKYEQ